MRTLGILLLVFNSLMVGQSDTDLPVHFFAVDPDDVTYLNDQKTSGPLPLSSDFILFLNSTDTINVNENGVLSFPSPMIDTIVRDIGNFHHGNLISIFWTDNMPVFGNAKITYTEYTPANGTGAIEQARKLISDNFNCMSNFEPESVFIVTWHDVHTRTACALSHSIEYCNCLGSDGHYGDADFCKCRQEHTESYCRECGSSGHLKHLKQFCKCLDSKDDLNYCTCKENKRHGADVKCKCLRDHDAHYCDCLEESGSTEHAWNCSCKEKHPNEICDCLAIYNHNEAFCKCYYFVAKPSRDSACDCYLSRSKEFCDCYYAHNGMEGYCDCIERGRPDRFCGCVQFNHLSIFDDIYLAEKFCECFLPRTAEPAWHGYEDRVYCQCVVMNGTDNCVGLLPRSYNRAVRVTAKDRAVSNGLVKDEGSTYQVVLISGGGMSFVVFNYGYFSETMAATMDIDGEFGRYRSGNFLSGLLSTYEAATVFYSLSMSYYQLSCYGQPWCFLEDTTHGIPGQHIYRTDQQDLVKPGCVTHRVIQRKTTNKYH